MSTPGSQDGTSYGVQRTKDLRPRTTACFSALLAATAGAALQSSPVKAKTCYFRLRMMQVVDASVNYDSKRI